MFEGVSHERSFNLKLSLTDPDTLTQSKFTDDEIKIIKNLALEKLPRQKCLRENFALQLTVKKLSTYPNLNNDPKILNKQKMMK